MVVESMDEPGAKKVVTKRRALPSLGGVRARHHPAMTAAAALIGALTHPGVTLAASSITARGDAITVDADRVVQDVLVVDGSVTVHGVVRGHIYAIDGEVLLEALAVVLKSIMVTRGALTIRPGAVLPPTIELTGARLSGPNGETADPRVTRSLAGGATQVVINQDSLNPSRVALMKSALAFERFVPRDAAAARRSHTLDLGMTLVRSLNNPKTMTLGGIAKLTFVSSKVVTSHQRGYSGPRGDALVSVIHLRDPQAGEDLWRHVQSVGPEVGVTLSVRSSLGDGHHWFFRRRDRFCTLWQRGEWLLAVETRLAADGATAEQNKQFNDQVLLALERSLGSPGTPPKSQENTKR